MLSKVIGIARQIRRSVGFRTAVSIPKRIAVATRQRTNNGVFSVEIEGDCGFFAIMQMILFILVHCEKNDLYPDISAKGGLYGEKNATVDWFKQLFASVYIPKPTIAQRLIKRTDIRTSKIKGIADLGFRARYEMDLTLEESSKLFGKYYRPSANIVAEVDSICDDAGISAHTLGVHYRGTDKIYESVKVSLQDVCTVVAKVAGSALGIKNIVLATDEVECIDFFKSYPFTRPVIVAPAKYLPRGRTPVHFSGHDGLAIGREALVTCLLLSRCGFLLKSASYLSGWSKIFNPMLPTWLIAPPNRQAFWFPDRILWLDQESGKLNRTAVGRMRSLALDSIHPDGGAEMTVSGGAPKTPK